MAVVDEKQIIQACSILFGDNFSVEKETIEYLQVSGIKQAFRSRVKEYHPDTARFNGAGTGDEPFLKLKDAYDLLVSVKSDKTIKIETDEERNQRHPAKNPRVLPRRKLRLGEYLYYTGRISWNELIAAITWQRRYRKDSRRTCLIGSYFTKFSIINHAELGFAVFKLNVHNSNY